MACASAHYEEMEDLVAAEVFVLAVEQRQLQCVDHAAYCINDPACQQPSNAAGDRLFKSCVNASTQVHPIPMYSTDDTHFGQYTKML